MGKTLKHTSDSIKRNALREEQVTKTVVQNVGCKPTVQYIGITNPDGHKFVW